MNGPHDMGGMQCYGPVVAEANEPLFHSEWERVALAITVGAGYCGMWNIDRSRHARETLPPIDYLSFSYYQIWIAALEKLLVNTGMASETELLTGRMELAPATVKRRVDGETITKILALGGPSLRESQSAAKFAIGDKVHTANFNPQGHTRLPRYARNATGKIHSLHGSHVFPDSNAHLKGEDPQWLYTVEFSARQLFGETADPNQSVYVDCWEPYLEHA